jgi:hypothetical protein
MNLADIQTAHFQPLLQGMLRAGYPRQAQIDYGVVFGTCVARGQRLWREQIVPEFGAGKTPLFEKALWRARMRPETSIPWPLAYGYAFGAACHAIAGGKPEERDAAATNSALAMFLIGLFDHLLDKFPREFGDIGKLVSGDAVRQYTLERNLTGLAHNPEQVLASGFVDLYRLYFVRCHRLLGLDKNSPIAQLWHTSLVRMHAAENASLGLRISKVPPTQTLIEDSEAPGSTSSWIVALSACLGFDAAAVKQMEPFAHTLNRLTRLVDSVVDAADDIKQDLWGGLAVRLALGATDQASADRIVMDVAEECVTLLTELAEGPASQLKWQAGDPFTLMDVFWAYLWSWAGGETPGWQPPSIAELQAAAMSPAQV